MKTDTKPTSNESENGNKSKPLLSLRLIKDFFLLKKQSKINKELNVAKLKDLTWRFPYLKFNEKDYFLADCKKGKYQAVTKKSYGWRYGDWSASKEIDMVLKISEIPSDWWLTIEDNGRPLNNSIVLLNYSDTHYEVAKYNNFTWVTELSFPVKFSKYLIISVQKAE